MTLFRLTTRQLQLIAASSVGLCLVLFLGFWVGYANKVLPGVSANGINIGGLNREAAIQQMHKQADAYAAQQIPVDVNGNTALTVPVGSLGVIYNDSAVDAALKYGRSGSLTNKIMAHLRSVFGRKTTTVGFNYSDEKLTPFLAQVDDSVVAPVANAQVSFANGQVSVTPSQNGKRLDRGVMMQLVESRLGSMGIQDVNAPVYAMEPSVDDAELDAAKQQAADFVSSPLTISIGGQEQTISEDKILSWVKASTTAAATDMVTDPLQSFYTPRAQSEVQLAVDKKRVSVFVGDLAKSFNRDATDAQLAFQDGQIQVTKPSVTGVQLDQNRALDQIIGAIGKNNGGRTVQLATSVKQADVREDNLDALGIKERISEGQTFFPGSTAARLTNVRVGQAKYNGVLLKPGQTFSFGEILGDVGAAQGYVPELVILGNHEEKQYGGGLCQVASTAFRAALNAGLPIKERYNHSFAVSYYTAPFGIPGVDATIYYPQVDFKFQNDTGHYILIQTKMQGTTLTFDFYGTKTKVGSIRGPEFISGTTDATQASHTVFYEDIKDLNGNLTKSVRFDSYYQPSTNFPIEQQHSGT